MLSYRVVLWKQTSREGRSNLHGQVTKTHRHNRAKPYCNCSRSSLLPLYVWGIKHAQISTDMHTLINARLIFTFRNRWRVLAQCSSMEQPRKCLSPRGMKFERLMRPGEICRKVSNRKFTSLSQNVSILGPFQGSYLDKLAYHLLTQLTLLSHSAASVWSWPR